MDSNRQVLSGRIGAIVLYATFALLMFGPLAFGAVEPWSIFVMEAGSVVLMLLWLAKQWIDEEIIISRNPLFLPISAFGALILTQIIFKTSAYSHDTISDAMQYCAYGMLCFLATQTLTRSTQGRQMGVALTLYGFALASFALLQGLTANGKLYWIRQPHLGGWIYGPYVNHNHYAGIMELLVPIPLVISFSHLTHEKERIAAGVAAAIMVSTIFLSGSRGGMLSIFVELAVLTAILFRRKRHVRLGIAAALFLLLLVGIVTWLGGKELTTRLSTISSEAHGEISGGTRISIDRDTLRMFAQKPILGWGLGCFPVVYPQFRSFYTNFFINEAHNDYLQLLAEMGLAGFAIMLWFLIAMYRRALSKIGNWNSEVTGALTLACLLGVTGILVHSLFDFNLQIPANAAFFYVYCGLAAAPPLLQRARKRRPVVNDTDQVPATEVVQGETA